MKNNAEVTSYCQSFLNTVVDYIRKNYDSDFVCTAKWDWDQKRKRSWGRANAISIAMRRHAFSKRVKEYKAFENDSVIGSFHSEDWTKVMRAVICHEVAHAWSNSNLEYNSHGTAWQEKYGILRTVFVNGNTYDLEYAPKLKRNVVDLQRKHIYQVNCVNYGLDPDTFGAKFKYNDNLYEIVGWNVKARKYFIEAIRIKDAATYVFAPWVIKNGLCNT